MLIGKFGASKQFSPVSNGVMPNNLRSMQRSMQESVTSDENMDLSSCLENRAVKGLLRSVGVRDVTLRRDSVLGSQVMDFVGLVGIPKIEDCHGTFRELYL